MVSILCVDRNSIYKTLGVDCWDKDRDIRNFYGKHPVICHPPCAQWGQMAHFANINFEEKELALRCVDLVRCNGGVLEHPAQSKLYPGYLPRPGGIDLYGGYSICVDLHWFGYPARKKTLLYIVGIPQKELPAIPYSLDAVTHTVCHWRSNTLPTVPKSQRAATPLNMALWLIETCNRINNIKNGTAHIFAESRD